MCTKLFFWNVRGLNVPAKHTPFCDWLRTNKPSFGILLETHIKDQNVTSLLDKLCRGWKFATNHASDEDGKIVVIWKDDVRVRILHQSRQTLTCEVTLPTTHPFNYTAVYASNLRIERIHLWVELLDIWQSHQLHLQPWILGGDFNEILNPFEHSLSEVRVTTQQMQEFKDF